jgi:hypothetical protein
MPSAAGPIMTRSFSRSMGAAAMSSSPPSAAMTKPRSVREERLRPITHQRPDTSTHSDSLGKVGLAGVFRPGGMRR